MGTQLECNKLYIHGDNCDNTSDICSVLYVCGDCDNPQANLYCYGMQEQSNQTQVKQYFKEDGYPLIITLPLTGIFSISDAEYL
jgi:hypothetical protein